MILFAGAALGAELNGGGGGTGAKHPAPPPALLLQLQWTAEESVGGVRKKCASRFWGWVRHVWGKTFSEKKSITRKIHRNHPTTPFYVPCPEHFQVFCSSSDLR